MGDRVIIGRYTRLDGLDDGLCLYCGEPADGRDHVLSVVFTRRAIAAGRILTDEERRMMRTAPACISCNSTLGGRYFPSLWERLMAIRRAIMDRDRHATAPEWSAKDLSELGRNLKGRVAELQLVSDTARRRLMYHSPILEPEGPCKGLVSIPRALMEPGILTMEIVDSVRALAALMNDLNIPSDLPVSKAGIELREHGFTARQSIVTKAQRIRRGEPAVPLRVAVADDDWVDALRDQIRD